VTVQKLTGDVVLIFGPEEDQNLTKIVDDQRQSPTAIAVYLRKVAKTTIVSYQ